MNLLLALLSAGLLILTFPRFDIGWLAPVALTPLLVAAAREPRLLHRFAFGYAAGIVYWFGVCYWIQFVLAVHGGMGEAAGWSVFLLFCFAKAIHMGAFAALAGIVIRRTWAIPAVAALWVAIEFTHQHLGFAWLPLGNAGTEMGIPMRLAPITGVWGLSFIFAAMATALTLPFLRRPRAQLLWLAMLPCLLLLPRLPEQQRGQSAAVLVQPNIPDDKDWTRASLQETEHQMALLSVATLPENGPPPDFIVWPEVPAPFYDEDPNFHALGATLAASTHAWFLSGVVARASDGPLNSALLISTQGKTVSRYDKMNLVPFGEFVPWPLGYLTKKISTEAGDFRAGTHVVVSQAGAHKIGTFICYESVFPNFIRGFASNGAEAMFNLSNDSWFGKTAARYQHLKIVRMRAAENRRWILRSTNDGITAAIDPAGRVVQTAPSYVQASTRARYSYESSRSLYTRYGDWFVLICAAITAIALVPSRSSSRLPRPGKRG